MPPFAYGTTRFIAGDSLPEPPEPANDDFPIAAHWQTPAEALQSIRQWIQEMRRELAADFTLRACPEHRQRWTIMHAMEKCARWHYYGER